MSCDLDLRPFGYDHHDAVALTALVQAEYERRYGHAGGDSSPIQPTEFSPPDGLFLIGYANDRPVAMGGWRRSNSDADADGELKRMFVRADARGHGYARAILSALESDARVHAVTRMVLQTGTAQPEAIGLYRSCGYADVEPFGYYAGYPDAVHLAKSL